VATRDLRRGQVNFRSHNSCLSLEAPSPGRRRACVLFGGFFRGGYSPTGLPGDTVLLALPPTGWGGMSVLSQGGTVPQKEPERFRSESHIGVLPSFERFPRYFELPGRRRSAFLRPGSGLSPTLWYFFWAHNSST